MGCSENDCIMVSSMPFGVSHKELRLLQKTLSEHAPLQNVTGENYFREHCAIVQFTKVYLVKKFVCVVIGLQFKNSLILLEFFFLGFEEGQTKK